MRVRELTVEDAAEIATWRYAGPWAAYDGRADQPVRAEDGYVAVCDGPVDGRGDRLVGFACVGAEARVPGLTELPGVVDLGVGMRPDLVGRGLGPVFAGTVIEHVRRTSSVPLGAKLRLRVVVQDWNQRSLRLTRRLGFHAVGEHSVVQDGRPVRYLVLERDLDAQPSAGAV